MQKNLYMFCHCILYAFVTVFHYNCVTKSIYIVTEKKKKSLVINNKENYYGENTNYYYII